MRDYRWLYLVGAVRRLAMKHLWAYVVCTLLVGVSLALPLFLYMREGKRQQAGL
jgi:hypothetical protein